VIEDNESHSLLLVEVSGCPIRIHGLLCHRHSREPRAITHDVRAADAVTSFSLQRNKGFVYTKTFNAPMGSAFRANRLPGQAYPALERLQLRPPCV